MTYEEAQQIAINAGALEPQGFGENMAYNFKKNENWFFQWADTPAARGRLIRWTDGVLSGIPAHQLKYQLG
jgi:hypothetical protein